MIIRTQFIDSRKSKYTIYFKSEACLLSIAQLEEYVCIHVALTCLSRHLLMLAATHSPYSFIINGTSQSMNYWMCFVDTFSSWTTTERVRTNYCNKCYSEGDSLTTCVLASRVQLFTGKWHTLAHTRILAGYRA